MEEEGDPVVLPVDVERTDIFPPNLSEQNKERLEVILDRMLKTNPDGVWIWFVFHCRTRHVLEVT